jgi:hypothetical protein
MWRTDQALQSLERAYHQHDGVLCLPTGERLWPENNWHERSTLFMRDLRGARSAMYGSSWLDPPDRATLMQPIT